MIYYFIEIEMSLRLLVGSIIYRRGHFNWCITRTMIFFLVHRAGGEVMICRQHGEELRRVHGEHENRFSDHEILGTDGYFLLLSVGYVINYIFCFRFVKDTRFLGITRFLFCFFIHRLYTKFSLNLVSFLLKFKNLIFIN